MPIQFAVLQFVPVFAKLPQPGNSEMTARGLRIKLPIPFATYKLCNSL